MRQYQNNNSKSCIETFPDKDISNQEFQTLKEQIKQQANMIQSLRRDIKKLKNEMRTTINAFNLNRNG